MLRKYGILVYNHISPYVFAFASCDFRYDAFEKLTRLSFRATLSFRLIRCWYLNHFQSLYLMTQIEFKELQI